MNSQYQAQTALGVVSRAGRYPEEVEIRACHLGLEPIDGCHVRLGVNFEKETCYAWVFGEVHDPRAKGDPTLRVTLGYFDIL